jgi:hypothetical protein
LEINDMSTPDLAAQAAQSNAQAQKAGRNQEFVTVGCKLPHGVVLRAFRMADTQEPIQGGGAKTVLKAEQLPGEFVVAGNSFPQGVGPKVPMEGGFALTPNCPKELWDRWFAANKDSPMVKNGLIFAHGSEKNTVAEAREKEAVRSGLERLDPTKLPGKIQKAEGIAA